MFKKTDKTPGSVSGPAPADETVRPDPFRQSRVKEHKRSILSPALSVNGDISGEEDLLLDGEMQGSVNLPDNEILIGPKGRVRADLTAQKVSVEGCLTGDIKSSERVVIKHSGRVEGNIVAPRVVLEDGCQFKGSVEMNIDSKSGATREPEGRQAAAPGPAEDPQKGESKPASGATASKPARYTATPGKTRASGAS